MRLRPLAILVVISVAVMFAISAWAWGRLPDGAQIPIHWGINGQPNGYGPKWIALLLTPALGAVLGLVFLVIPRLDPRREHLVASSRAWIATTGSVMLLLVIVHATTVAIALGATIDIGRVLGVALGGMLVVIGNFLGKTRSNWFIGIRTPWTLSSERSWTRTHRLGGRFFVAVGLISIVLGLVSTAEIVFSTILPGIGATTVLLVVYSYLIWRDDPERRPL